MNDFEADLGTALRAEVDAVAASVDGARAALRLESGLDRVDQARRRRIWVSSVAVGAAAVITVVALAGHATRRAAPTPATQPSPSGAPSLSTERLPGSPGQYAWAAQPAGLAVGPAGTIYVWDLSSLEHRFRIRAITPTGHILSTASQPSAGWDAGFRAAAVDGAGNAYVATDTEIRKISLDDQMSTLAGGATAGSVDGIGTGARFHGIIGMAISPTGDLYVTGAGVVRRVTPEGKVDTLTGCAYPQPITEAASDCLGWPGAIAVGPTGTIFIGTDDYRIRTITPDGTVAEMAVGDLGGTGLFHRMLSLAVDPQDSNLVVHDVVGWHTVAPDGKVSAAPAALVGLSSIAVGADGTTYSIDRGAIVILRPGG